MSLVSRLSRRLRELWQRLWYCPLRLFYCRSPRFRSWYWQFRAPDVHAQWGFTTTNFDNLTSVIESIAPERVLDFGCGSGRLLPLFADLAIPEVAGYDVSPKALDFCRERCAGKIALFSGDVSALPYPANYFDLAICNRVLQHIPPKEVGRALSEVAHYAKSLYLCEMSRVDATSRFFFMFRHDYDRILAPLGFRVVREGGSGPNHWILFSRLSQPAPVARS